MTLGIEHGYTIFGGLFATQEEAREALRAFDEGDEYELHPDMNPQLGYDDTRALPFKLSVVARRRKA